MTSRTRCGSRRAEGVRTRARNRPAADVLPNLFDTNAVSEAMRPRPNEERVGWLAQLPREEQFTSSVVIGEMYAGAYASQATAEWLARMRSPTNRKGASANEPVRR